MYKIYLWKANGIPKYVGSTKLKLTRRIQLHTKDKRSAIYQYMQEYPDAEFSYIIIDYADTKEEALLKESFWTDFYRERFSMINKFTGTMPDDNTRSLWSKQRKGKKISEEHKEKIRIANTGTVFTEERRKNISEALKGKPSPIKGRKRSEEFKKKVSEAQKKYWKTHTPPNLGKHLSEKTKKKISESHKGLQLGKTNPRATKVRIKETNMVFDTINECAEYLNVSRVTVRQSARNNKKMRCGFTAEYIDIS